MEGLKAFGSWFTNVACDVSFLVVMAIREVCLLPRVPFVGGVWLFSLPPVTEEVSLLEQLTRESVATEVALSVLHREV